MTNINMKPKKILVLSTDSRIKAYVHPTRIAILSMLAAKKKTVSNVAKELGVHPANITHHFRLLEKAGLIKLVERRDIGKNIEKYYRAIARNFIIGVEKRGKSNKQALELAILRNDLSTAISTVKRNDKHDVVAVIKIARILPHDVKLLRKKIMKIIREFSRYDSAKGRAYTLNISVYPTEADHVSRAEIIIDR
jgi:DNA-binding transcriptional ArsR family regulator